MKRNKNRGWLHLANLGALIDAQKERLGGSYRWVGSVGGYSLVIIRDKASTIDLRGEPGE